MRYRLTIAFAAAAALMALADAQTITPSPLVAGCPSPLPAQSWPPSSCKYQFYPLTDTTHAIASRSKSIPVYQHTYGAYGPTDLLVACPAGANITAGGVCTDAAGNDVSQVVAKSAIPALTMTFTPTPPPVCPDTFVPMNWTCSVSNGTATCTAPIK